MLLVDHAFFSNLKKSGFKLSRSSYLIKINHFTSISFLDFEITSFNFGKVMVNIPFE